MIYKQLLRTQIPKVQKDTDDRLSFALLESTLIQAACKHAGEIEPSLQMFFKVQIFLHFSGRSLSLCCKLHWKASESA
jgi:hypothetical protein